MLCMLLLLGGLAAAQDLPGIPPRPEAPGGEGVGSLAGKVESYKGRGLVGATVRLGDGQSTVTDASGGFRLEGIAPGDYTVQVSCKGFKTAGGKVHIEAGQTRSLLVNLKRDGAAADSSRSVTLWVEAYTVSNGGRRSWVSKIEVWEWGNSRRTWSNYWWSDTGDTYRSLACPGARMNQSYEIAITWTAGKGYRTRRTVFQRKVWSSSQVERFYHP